MNVSYTDGWMDGWNEGRKQGLGPSDHAHVGVMTRPCLRWVCLTLHVRARDVVVDVAPCLNLPGCRLPSV